MTAKLSESTKNSIKQYIELNNPNSSQQVADKFGVSRKTIERLDSWRDYKKDKKRKYEERLRLAIIFSVDNPEATISEISKKFNISRATLQKKIPHYIEKSNKLTDLEVQEILYMYANHPYITISDIAKSLNHCPKVVKKYINLYY